MLEEPQRGRPAVAAGPLDPDLDHVVTGEELQEPGEAGLPIRHLAPVDDPTGDRIGHRRSQRVLVAVDPSEHQVPPFLGVGRSPASAGISRERGNVPPRPYRASAPRRTAVGGRPLLEASDQPGSKRSSHSDSGADADNAGAPAILDRDARGV